MVRSSPADDFVLHKRDSADDLQGLSSRMQALLLQVPLQSLAESWSTLFICKRLVVHAACCAAVTHCMWVPLTG